MDGKPLSAKQQAFVDEYLKDRNATAAYRRAGYNPKNADANAARLMGNDGVASAIKARTEAVSEKAEINAAWVLAGLVENAQRALQAVPVLDKEGNSTGEWKYEGSVANRAFELIGKHIGMFSDHLTIKHDRTNPDLEGLPGDDLRAILLRRRAGLGKSSSVGTN